MKVRRAGDRALLVETGDLATAHRLHATLTARRRPGLIDIVPGARTVLVVVDPATCDLDRLAAEIPRLPLAETASVTAAPVEIPVVYDGPDLTEVARLSGLSAAEVVARHAASPHVVAYLGFSPGFAYIAGLDPALHVPRRATPRARVPAGSVAVADRYSGVYPTASPGGWRLIGRTDVRVWDVDRDPPALLQPGTRVHFVPTRS